MDVATLISRMRIEVLDDNITPYLWSNVELIYMLNDTINELVEENLMIVDQDSPSTRTEISLLSNTTIHSINTSILHVRFGYLLSTGYGVIRTTEDWLNANISDWRTTTGSGPTYFAPSAWHNYLSIYPKYDTTYYYLGVSNISFVGGTTKSITQTGGDFSGLAVGDKVYINYSTSNTGTFTVVTVGTTSFTVSETVTDEPNSSARIRKVEDTLVMTINRMPQTEFTSDDITAATTITDIQSVHHRKLFNGIAKRAFLKPDSETYDKGKAEYHRGLFEVDKKKIKRSQILFNKPDKTRTIRSGTGIGY